MVDYFNSDILDEGIIFKHTETFISRPDFLLKNNIELYHGTSRDLEKLSPISRNLGTKISNPRQSVFLTDNKTHSLFAGIITLLYDTFDNMENESGVVIDERKKLWTMNVSDNVLYLDNRFNNDAFISTLSKGNIYIYGFSINPKELGRGHVPKEYTIDKEISPSHKEIIKYNEFSRYIKFISNDEFERVKSKRDADYAAELNFIDKILYVDKSGRKAKDKIYKELYESSTVQKITKSKYPFGIEVDGEWNAIEWIKGNPYRDTIETLIIQDDSIFLCFKSEDKYRVPGGSKERHKTPLMQAIAECQEEARITPVNIRTTNIKYIEEYTDSTRPKWMTPKLTQHGLIYSGRTTEIFIAEYGEKFTGHVEDNAVDYAMENDGKFYKISSVYSKLIPAHKKVIDKYVKLNESLLSESSGNIKLYHLSESNLDGKILKPRIPDNQWTRTGHEENKTPRVSFSSSIDGSLMGITGDLTGKEFYIHEIDKSYSVPRIRTISNKEVPDQFITEEVWVLNEVRLKNTGKIKVTRSYEKIFKQGNGTMSNLTYDWNKINESFINEGYGGRKLYHLSESNLDGKILKPRIPDNYMTKNGYEENKTPRISFSKSIDGALTGMSANIKDTVFYIHEPTDYSTIKIKNITNKEVPDQSLTDEVWVMSDVKLRVVGKIRVTNTKDKVLHYTYANGKEAEMYSWNYVKLNESYDRPYSTKEVISEYGKDTYDKLSKDSAHKFRMDSGIELIHKEPSLNELNRIWKNWNEMNDKQKMISDKKSVELFGMTNMQHYNKLISQYKGDTMIKNLKESTSDLIGKEVYLAKENRKTKVTEVDGDEDAIYDKDGIIDAMDNIYKCNSCGILRLGHERNKTCICGDKVGCTPIIESILNDSTPENTNEGLGVGLTIRNTLKIIQNVSQQATKTGKWAIVEKNILAMVNDCRTVSDIEYIRRDLYRGKKYISNLSISEKDKDIANAHRKHLEWLNTTYTIAINKKMKELKDKEKTNESYLEEGFNSPDMYLNFGEWGKPGKNILFVIGLSGSGKSTLTKSLATEYGAKVLTFDCLGSYILKGKIKPIHGEESIKITKEYVQDKPYLATLKPSSWDDPIMFEETRKFFEYLKIKLNSTKEKYIIEGMQIFIDLADQVDYFKDMPFIIKETSMTTSIFRRYKRGVVGRVYEPGQHGDSSIIQFTFDYLRGLPKLIYKYDKDSQRLHSFKSKLTSESYLEEKALSSKERNALDDDKFGIPQEKKYPMTDAGHVADAKRWFNKAKPEYQTQLADKIFQKSEEFNIPIYGGGEWFQHISPKVKAYWDRAYDKNTGKKMHPVNEKLDYNDLSDSLNEADIIYKDTLYQIELAECNLKRYAKENDVNYYDDIALLEAYEYCNNESILNENIISKGWQSAKEIAKKAIQAVIYIWKKIVGFFRDMIERVKAFFSKRTTVSPKPVNVTLGAVDGKNARNTSVTVSSLEQLQAHINQINNAISRTIGNLSSNQNNGMTNISRAVDKKAEQSAVSEAKEYHGKEVANVDAGNIGSTIATYAGAGNLTSLHGDAFESLLKMDVSTFDKHKAEVILESENIVEAYKEFVNCEFVKFMSKNHKELQKEGSLWYNMRAFADLALNFYDQDSIAEYLIGNYINIPDDPEKVKRMINLRISYNNKMIAILQEVMRVNYKILGVSEAEMLRMTNSTTPSPSDIRKILLANSDKFYNKERNIWNMRELNGGLFIVTKSKAGMFGKVSGIEKYIQELFRWDAIVVAHGDEESDSAKSLVTNDKFMDKKERMENAQIRYADLEANGGTKAQKTVTAIQYKRHATSLIKDATKAGVAKTEAIEKGETFRWVMQPCYSLSGGPYTDMNSLVRQLIKEGCKKIKIMTCNPGHHLLAPDIRAAKGVIINYALNSVLAESEQVSEAGFSPAQFDKNLMNDEKLVLGNGLVPVYIMLSSSGSVVNKAIKKVTHTPYGHASISFDPDLKTMFSFGMQGGNAFLHETKEDILKKFPEFEYLLYTVYVDMQTKCQMKEFVKSNFIDRYDEWRYNFKALLGYMVNKPIEVADAMVCSEFVNNVLKYGNIDLFNKSSSLVHPYDFAKSKKTFFIKKGKLKDFDAIEVIEKTKKSFSRNINIFECNYNIALSGENSEEFESLDMNTKCSLSESMYDECVNSSRDIILSDSWIKYIGSERASTFEEHYTSNGKFKK